MSQEGEHQEYDSNSESCVETPNQPPADITNSAVRCAHNEWVAEQRDNARRQAVLARVRAHESVREEWTRYCEKRPEGVREVVWRDPLFEPLAYTTKLEQRFCETRRLRIRVLRWQGEIPGGLA